MMNVRTERTEMLPGGYMGLQSRATNNVTSTKMLRPTNKESVYTFSENSGDEPEDNSPPIARISTKYRPRLHMSTHTDRLQTEKTKTQTKKRSSTSSTSRPSNKSRRKQVATSTMPSPNPPAFPSYPPMQPEQQHQLMGFAPSYNTVYDLLQPKSNGSMFAEPSSSSSPSSSSLNIKRKKDSSGGKPLAFAMAAEKMKQQASVSIAPAKPKPRNNRKKSLVAMYQSQLSDNVIGIKIRLKKSIEQPIRNAEASIPSPSSTSCSSSSRKKKVNASPSTSSTQVAAPSTSRSPRKRSRRSRQKEATDSDDSEFERRRSRNNNSTSEKRRSKTQPESTADTEDKDKDNQTPSYWADLPKHIIHRIFQGAVHTYGALPTVINLSKVCNSWRDMALYPEFWETLDVATWAKDKSEYGIKNIALSGALENCKDLNLADCKVTNVDCVLEHLYEACPQLEAIGLAGWKNLSQDNIMLLVERFQNLQRLDLSSVNAELNPNRSAVGPVPIAHATQKIAEKLTHLNLSHNRLAGIPQLITTLSENCKNLSLLDLSNVTTVAASHGILHIEQLQEGCPNLKVLRITNSQITLGPPPSIAPTPHLIGLEEQLPPGFRELEELSVASLADESRLMSDEFLWRILWASSKLKLLDIRGCARLTHQTLIRLQTWELKHLFLSGCNITRDTGSGLELIAEKWAGSLIELDLAWANVQEPLDNALKVIAETGRQSPMINLNLCGSSVSEEAVKEILANCKYLSSINLASCRGLPRGVKRHIQGMQEIDDLRETLKVSIKFPPRDRCEQTQSPSVADK